MSEANNFHSVIYYGHYHRSILFNRAVPLQLVDEGKKKKKLHFYSKEERVKKENKKKGTSLVK